MGSLWNADAFAHKCAIFWFGRDRFLQPNISKHIQTSGTLDLKALQEILGKTDLSSNEQWILACKAGKM
jgi:hypothetical protein